MDNLKSIFNTLSECESKIELCDGKGIDNGNIDKELIELKNKLLEVKRGLRYVYRRMKREKDNKNLVVNKLIINISDTSESDEDNQNLMPNVNNFSGKIKIHYINITDIMFLSYLSDNISVIDIEIKNIDQFKKIRFYFRHYESYNGLYKLNKGSDIYYIAENGILYTLKNNKLVAGYFNKMAQYWKAI